MCVNGIVVTVKKLTTNQDVKIFRLAPKSLYFKKYSTFLSFFFLAVNQSAKSETLSLQSSTHSSRSNTLERPSKPNKDSGLQPRLPTHEVFFLGSKFHELRFYSKKWVSKLGNYR